MSFHIRDATESEISTIIELSMAGAIEANRFPDFDANEPGYVAAFRAIAADANHRLVVVEDQGELIGTMQISFIPGLPGGGAWRGQLENVHIRADYRGRGIGAMLTDWAVDRCREKGCKMVQLTSNKKRKDAHRFYARLGFEATHEGFKMKL